MTEHKPKLTQLAVAGYKSIHPDGVTISFGAVTILLGANGSGKSNLVSFLRLLREMAHGRLQAALIREGGAKGVLHRGKVRADEITCSATLVHDEEGVPRRTTYRVQAAFSRPNGLGITSEEFDTGPAAGDLKTDYVLNASGDEAHVSHSDRPVAARVQRLLSHFGIFHFHDTSDGSRMHLPWRADDNEFLRSDGANLAAVLRRLKLESSTRPYYDRIVSHIRRVLPQFKDFDLDLVRMPDPSVQLDWHDQFAEEKYWPHQLSDGSLRFIALATILLQPVESLPSVIVLDEPELGLHPSAIAELAAMIRVASQKSQVVVATQSPRLVDEFELDDLVIVERDEQRNCSVFRRLDANELNEWLAAYCLSELWEKNVLGGLP